MKKFTQKILLFTLASTVFLTSCGDDEDPVVEVPSITVTAAVNEAAIVSGAEVEVGSTITFTVGITAPGGVNTLWIGNDAVSRTVLGVDAGATTASYSFTSDVTQEGVLSLEVYAVDDADQSSATTTFTVTGVVTSPDAKVLTAIMLAAPDAEGTLTAFYSVGDETLYSHNDVIGTAEAVSQNIDFGYYYGANDEASLVSPSEYPASVFDISAWTTRNETVMVYASNYYTTEDYMGLQTVADVTAWLDNLDANAVEDDIALGFSGLSAGDLIAFETAGEIAGIIRVTQISGTFNAGDFIELEFILAEAADEAM